VTGFLQERGSFGVEDQHVGKRWVTFKQKGVISQKKWEFVLKKREFV
jgi:hypothetical protein